MSIAHKLSKAIENTPKVFDAGKQAEYDRFWDTYQQNGKRTEYPYAFGGRGWTPDTFKPKYDMAVFTGSYMFASSNLPIDLPAYLEQLGVKLDLSAVAAITYMFQSSTVTRVGVIGCIGTSFMACFNNCKKLATIDRMIVKKDLTYTATFDNCTSLQNLTIEGVIGNAMNVSACPLTHESLMSILNALEAKTSGTFALTLGTTNLAKLSDAEKAIATEKGWTLA